MNLKGWAGYPTLNTSLFISEEISEIQKKISEGSLIARGNGRWYANGGDKMTFFKNCKENCQICGDPAKILLYCECSGRSMFLCEDISCSSQYNICYRCNTPRVRQAIYRL